MSPLVTVIVDTYNFGCFIEGCLESVFAQDLPADQVEILVVDNGSTDDTIERVKKYGDRVKYLPNPKGDQCSALTRGVAEAKGALVAFLDGDDVWFPTKLSRVVQEFEKNTRVVMVYHKFVYWDSRSDTEWPGYFSEVSGDVLADARKLASYAPTPTSSLAFRRESFRPLLNIPLNRAYQYDSVVTRAALFLGPIACIPEVLTKNRVHGNNRWAADRSGPDEKRIRIQLARREAAIEILHDWISVNAPNSTRQARVLTRLMRLTRDEQELLITTPGRLRLFLYRTRRNLAFRPLMTRSHLAYRWLHAFAELLCGKHVHYLEGARTRARRVRDGLHRGKRVKADSETVAE